MQIIPAILPRDFEEIEEKVKLVKGIVKTVQVDICDGKLTPKATWPYRKTDENFEALLREDRGMPEWESLDYEFDLMISSPTVDDARKWLSAGVSRMVLHLESSDDLSPVLEVLDGLVEIGLAINTNTELEDLAKYKEKIDYIQLMGIEKIGFQGQDFKPDTVDRVKKAKELFPDLQVQVDGGVTLENAPLLKHAGVDRLVVGSALFESEDVVDSFNKFNRI